MTVTLDTMRKLVRKACGVPEGDEDLTNDDIDLALNMSYWEVMDIFPFREKQRTGQFLCTIGVRQYEIPRPVEAVTNVAVVRDSDFQHIPLDQMDARETELLYNQQASFRGLPKKYLLENCYIRLWPTPDKEYTIVLRKNTILSDIQSSGIAIPQRWNDIIIYGADWRILADQGDVQKSTFYNKLQAKLIASATPREEKEQGVDYAHAGVYVYGYEDRNGRHFNIKPKW